MLVTEDLDSSKNVELSEKLPGSKFRSVKERFMTVTKFSHSKSRPSRSEVMSVVAKFYYILRVFLVMWLLIYKLVLMSGKRLQSLMTNRKLYVVYAISETVADRVIVCN